MKYYINKNNEMFGIDTDQEHLIQPDWVLCQLDSNGNLYDAYNANGTPDLVKDESIKIQNAKTAKESEIRAAYEAAANSDVSVSVSVNGTPTNVNFQGGFDSAIKLDAARRLSETAGLTTVTFFDKDNNGYSLSLSDALNVILAVSQAFQTALAKKQDYFVQIAQASTIADIQAIQWV